MTTPANRVRAALRDLVDGRQILERVEYVTQCLLSGYELQIDPVTREQAYLPIDAVAVARLRTALDVQLKLLGKVLPDLKAVELSGPDGGPLDVVQHSDDRLVLATKLLALWRETRQPGVIEHETPVSELPKFLN